MLEEMNLDLFNKLLTAINRDESISMWLEAKGFPPAKQMNCIFHEDRSPSLAISEELGKWHCFSCGLGGRYFDLLYNYYIKVDGGVLSKQYYLNELLLKNKQWQKKYNLHNLITKVPFSKDTLSYLYNVDKASRGIKREIANIVRTDGKLKLCAKYSMETEIITMALGVKRGDIQVDVLLNRLGELQSIDDF